MTRASAPRMPLRKCSEGCIERARLCSSILRVPTEFGQTNRTQMDAHIDTQHSGFQKKKQSKLRAHCGSNFQVNTPWNSVTSQKTAMQKSQATCSLIY